MTAVATSETVGEAYPWLPDTSWPVLQPFWEALARGELRFPRCEGCERWQWYPQERCPSCGSRDFAWQQVEPRGTIYSYTDVQQPFIPEFRRLLPLYVVLVDVEVGSPQPVRLVTNLVGDVDGLEIGAAVDIEPREVADGVHLPFARLSSR